MFSWFWLIVTLLYAGDQIINSLSSAAQRETSLSVRSVRSVCTSPRNRLRKIISQITYVISKIILIFVPYYLIVINMTFLTNIIKH